MKPKITFGIAWGLAFKEKTYVIGFVIAIVLLLLGTIGAAKFGWYYPFRAVSFVGLAFVIIGIILILARPANIGSDPTASGHPEYDSYK